MAQRPLPGADRASPNVGQVYFDPASWETYFVALAVVIPGKWVECPQLHPSPAELLGGVQRKATYVGTHLEGHAESSGAHPLAFTRGLPPALS